MLNTQDIANIPVTVDYLLKVRKEAVRISGSRIEFDDKAVTEVFNDAADILTAALAVYNAHEAIGYGLSLSRNVALTNLKAAIEKFEG